MYIFRSEWPANADVFLVVANPQPKRNNFSSEEKQRKEIRLRSQARTSAKLEEIRLQAVSLFLQI